MSRVLRRRARAYLEGIGLTAFPEHHGDGIHRWRCEHPDTYGCCDCLSDAADNLAALMQKTRAEGAREALAQLDVWLDEQAQKHPRFNEHLGLCRLNVQRFRDDHYPERTDHAQAS